MGSIVTIADTYLDSIGPSGLFTNGGKERSYRISDEHGNPFIKYGLVDYVGNFNLIRLIYYSF